MSNRKMALPIALLLCACLLYAPALPGLAEARGAEQAPSPEDTTLADYAQQLFPEHILTEAEAEAVEVLFGFSQEILAFEAKAAAADTGDLKLVRDLLRAEERLEDTLDAYEDTLEASYRADALVKESYRVLDNELERLDDRLDEVEDMLERYWDE